MKPIPEAVEQAAANLRASHPEWVLIFPMEGRRIVYAPGSEATEFTTMGTEEIARDMIRAGRKVAVCEAANASAKAAIGEVA